MRNIKPTDSGKYTCKIDNNIGSGRTDSNIRVNCKPKFIRSFDNVDAFYGENITLNCEVSGTPEPKVTWFKDDQIYKPMVGSSVTYKNGECTLNIVNATISNNGEYKCKAQNKSGYDEIKAIVNIKGLYLIIN